MTKVAIIGLSYRFPSTNQENLWADLLSGRDLVTQVAPDRWSPSAFFHPSRQHPGTSYTFAAGSIGDVSGFDAEFFNISPREAGVMDPQHRILLELSWEAFENAGIPPSKFRGSRCGVFIGISSSDYAYRMADDLSVIDSFTATGNTASVAANRLSYFFDLRGPSMALDTACSSSLVALHQACQSIVTGESTFCLTGGVSLHLHPFGFITFSKASMLSRQGHCRVFDATGDGYVRSEGAGVFLLKAYDQALADGDRILAVIAHTAVNTDGHKSGLTVPNVHAQAELLTEAYQRAGISPESIDYIEAHGTGTAVGDPIETRALSMALAGKRSRENPLLIGSVKSNLGHLETASGVAGLVKAVYALQHRIVPATIGLETENPHIPFAEWNLQVVTENLPLKQTGTLTIGVNSFGFGGANAHAILQNPPSLQRRPAQTLKQKCLPFIVSAQTSAALRAAADTWAKFLQTQAEDSHYDLAFATWNRRERLAHRAVLYGNSPAEIAHQLHQFAIGQDSQVETAEALPESGSAVFVYSGNGSQWEGMGKQLIQVPAFRRAIKRIDKFFLPLAGYTLLDELAGKLGENRYRFTEYAQPALFAMQVGITELLKESGLIPAGVIGHSVGEVAAAWACGALSLEDAVTVVFHRSRLQALTKGLGQMTAAGMDVSSAEKMLDDLGISKKVTIAGHNSPKAVTLAGDVQGLGKIEAMLQEKEIFFKRLDLDYAFHSPAMNGIQSELVAALEKLKPTTSKIPFYSSVTGGVLIGNQLNSEYWWQNVRNPVLFHEAVSRMVACDCRIFVEIGPHPVLKTYLNDTLKNAEQPGRVIDTLRRDEDHPASITRAAALAFIAGAELQQKALFPQLGQFIELPSYPWQRESCWHPVSVESYSRLNQGLIHPLLGYPLPQQDFTFESHLDIHSNPSLGDHLVGDEVVFPCSGFVELALAASYQWLRDPVAEIEELEIKNPLMLGADHAKTTRLGIDTQDGSFNVKARDLAGPDPMTLHATGRILREPAEYWSAQPMPLIPAHKPDFDGTTHTQALLQAGFAYGPSYRAVQAGWLGAETIIAKLELPESIAADHSSYYLHPAILDSVFQLIIHFQRENIELEEGIAYVPSKVGRIIHRTGLGIPWLAHVKLTKLSPHSLLADFSIYDQSGALIASVFNVRFRSIRMRRGSSDQIRYVMTRTIPKPLSIKPLPNIPSFEQVKSSLSEAVRRCLLKGLLRSYAEEIDPLLDSLCAHFVVEQFANPNPFQSNQYYRYLQGILDEDGLSQSVRDLYRDDANIDQMATAQDIWNSLVADYPDFFKIIHIVGRVGLHLKALLEGRISLEQLCPQDTLLSLLRRQVIGSDTKQVLSSAIRELLESAMGRLPEGYRLGLLEISEGTPWFASEILARMDFDLFDYGFASHNAKSLEDAKRLKERYPSIRLFNLAEANTLHKGTYQLAILSTDIPRMVDTLAALGFAKELLCENGTLALLGQYPSRWVDFVFGSTPDWWEQGSGGIIQSRQKHPIYWQSTLEKYGFIGASLMEFSPAAETGPYLMLAQSDTTKINTTASIAEDSKQWLLLADTCGYSAALAERLIQQLSEAGKSVRRLSLGDTGQPLPLLKDTLGLSPKWAGIVYVSGLGGVSGTSEPKERLQAVTSCCLELAALAVACEETATTTCCWIVTAGALTDTLPQRAATGWRTSPASLADSVLWGFTRSLNNESSNLDFRLVDLEDPFSLETASAALIQGFEYDDLEQEILITRSGERFVTRLSSQTKEFHQCKNPRTETPQLRLGFSRAGQVRNLRWEEHATRVVAADQVEIEVRATGLNFRDVMFALGLLTEEAVEAGFAGSTLGLEFSGVVTAVGKSVENYVPGDRVVGFGSASFATRVVTQVGAVAPIPSGLSFEAAATIPSAFFTAYYALQHLACLGKGEKVLIHGAAGGVGLAAIQVAKWCEAEIYATAGSEEKRDFLKLLGVNHVYDSRSLAFAGEILADTNGAGVDVILNSLAGEAVNRNLNILRPFGRFLELGKRDFYENNKISLRPFRNNISYFGIDADQLMSNQPKLTAQLFREVMVLFNEGILHPLPYCSFEAEDVVNAFRYMQQSKQVGKVVISYRYGISCFKPKPASKSIPLALNPGGTFLITGGLSGFGLETAKWLVNKGVRSVVLLSRRGPVTEEAVQGIVEMENAGAKVMGLACDITDKQQLKSVLARVSAKLPPLKGIVHSAMAMDDKLARQLSAIQMTKVLEPKILGALNLHELTMGFPLEYFILYSSATTFFGNPGQSSYVAANFWLEALSRHRNSMGLPSFCILWGAIADVGFLSRNPSIKSELQTRIGGNAISSEVALGLLEDILLKQQTGRAILEFEWQRLSKLIRNPDAPKYSEINYKPDEIKQTKASQINIQRLLTEYPDSEIIEVFKNLLIDEISEILKLAPDKIDATKKLQTMGLDSLMSVELLRAVEFKFGVNLPIMALSESRSIEKLANTLLNKLKTLDGAATYEDNLTTHEAQVQQAVSLHAPEATLSEVNRFTDDITQSNTTVFSTSLLPGIHLKQN